MPSTSSRAARHGMGSDFHRALHYTACEPSARKREALADRFSTATGEPNLDYRGHSLRTTGPNGASSSPMKSSMPCPSTSSASPDGEWNERLVTLQEWQTGLDRDSQSPTAPFDQHLDNLPSGLPNGYSTEVGLQLGFPSFAICQGSSTTLSSSSSTTASSAEDYYHPNRTEGTLQTYAHHQAGDDPLDTPGQRDLTTHLDFTSVREAAARRRPAVPRLCPSGKLPRPPRLRGMLLRPLRWRRCNQEFLRQFQTLTHPAFFGSRFHAPRIRKGRAISSGLSFPGQA